MDIYHIWCDTRPGVQDTDFAAALERWMAHLANEGLIEGWRLSRRKLGLGPRELGEFHVTVETRDMSQLEAAFQAAASRAEPHESVHQGVNSLARNLTFALYRDFPDEVRKRGQERF
ncbi:MAG: DUF6614 family protein [Rhodovibrionaceae bacterium]|nr:DUF6614 family protein [Rhodovibrionaceae bacterium]